MSRKNKVRNIIFICIVLVCAVLFFSISANRKTISEDAVFVRACDLSGRSMKMNEVWKGVME